MTPTLPGDHIRRIIERWVDSATMREVVDPTLADLQHETVQANCGAWRRRLIVLRGHTALLRALVLCGAQSGHMATELAVLFALGLGGTALVIWARAAHSDGRVLNSAILLPLIATPLVLRLLGLGMSYRHLFVGTALVGLAVRMLSYDFGPTASSIPLWLRTTRMILPSVPIILVSAATAAVAWRPRTGPTPFARQLAIGLFAGGLAAAATFGPVVAWPHGETPIAIATAVPFYICLFGVVLTVTVGPLLLLARLWIRARSRLALTGAVLSPVAICPSSYLDGGTITQCLQILRNSPGMFLVTGLPWIAGAIVLGWALAATARARQD